MQGLFQRRRIARALLRDKRLEVERRRGDARLAFDERGAQRCELRFALFQKTQAGAHDIAGRVIAPAITST